MPILDNRCIHVDVPINHLVVLRDVTGKQTYPRRQKQLTSSSFQSVVKDDFRNWVPQGQEAAAVVSSPENLPESSTSLIPVFTGRGRLCRCKTVSCAHPRNHCVPHFLKGSIASLLGVNAWLSQNCHIPPPVFAPELTTLAAPSGWQVQRVHVEVLESFRSASIAEVASSLARLQVTEEGGFGDRLPANSTRSLEETAFRPPLKALDRSRSALGLTPPVVVGDGLGADEQGRCPHP